MADRSRPAPGLPKPLAAARDEIRDFIRAPGPDKTCLEGFQAVTSVHGEWDRLAPWIPGSRRIGRTEIQALSEACASGQAEWITLFCLSMIWSASETAETNQRARLLLALRTPDRDAIIATAAQLTRQGDFQGGLRATRRLDRIGTTNATKFLFAVGISLAQPPRPLSIDQRVAASLVRLLTPGMARERYGIKPWGKAGLQMLDRSGSYMTYCVDLESWSRELGSEASQLERFLAMKGGEFGAGAGDP